MRWSKSVRSGGKSKDKGFVVKIEEETGEKSRRKRRG